MWPNVCWWQCAGASAAKRPVNRAETMHNPETRKLQAPRFQSVQVCSHIALSTVSASMPPKLWHQPEPVQYGKSRASKAGIVSFLSKSALRFALWCVCGLMPVWCRNVITTTLTQTHLMSPLTHHTLTHTPSPAHKSASRSLAQPGEAPKMTTEGHMSRVQPSRTRQPHRVRMARQLQLPVSQWLAA